MEITAPRNFSPGEVICTEKPFIELLNRKFKDVACSTCFQRALNLKYCKACLNVKYCGKECQKKNWKDHKLECQKLKNLPPRDFIDVDLIRVVGNVILKIKGKDWKTIKSNIMGMDVSFDDIEPEFPCSPRTYIHHNWIKENVRRYIGDENMPNEDDFKKISGKVHPFIIGGIYTSSHLETSSFYIGLSVIQFECIPNCHFSKKNDINRLIAIKKIEKSEKLSVNKYDVLDYPASDGGFNTPCNCTDCRLPYGESVLSKVIDKQRAYGVITASQQFINMWHIFPIVRNMTLMKSVVDDLLQKHEGVLGDTNALHLKLLAIKCLDIGGDPLEMMSSLLKLEKNVVAVLGEYYPELRRIYKCLAGVFFYIGNIPEGMRYQEKIQSLMSVYS